MFSPQLRRILSKVDEMKSQRVFLVKKLRESVLADDITKKLMIQDEESERRRGKGSKLETVCGEEIAKYDGQTKVIRQNLLAQENILR